MKEPYLWTLLTRARGYEPAGALGHSAELNDLISYRFLAYRGLGFPLSRRLLRYDTALVTGPIEN